MAKQILPENVTFTGDRQAPVVLLAGEPVGSLRRTIFRGKPRWDAICLKGHRIGGNASKVRAVWVLLRKPFPEQDRYPGGIIAIRIGKSGAASDWAVEQNGQRIGLLRHTAFGCDRLRWDVYNAADQRIGSAKIKADAVALLVKGD